MAFVTDTFTDTNNTDLESHTGELGATWAKHPTTTGNARIANDGSTSKVAATTSSSTMYVASGAPAGAEYDVEFTATRIGATAVNFAFAAGRIHATDATFYVGGYNFATSTWIIQKRVAGTSTTLHEVAGTWAENDTKTIKLEIRDATKKLYDGATEVCTTADNTITAAGKSGIRVAGLGTYAAIDSFSAADAGGSANATADGGTGTVTVTGSGGDAVGAAPNAVADGGTGTITVTGSGGDATGGTAGTNGSADGGTGTITVTGTGGDAVGTATGSFTTDAMENNTGAGLLVSVAAVWTWYKGAIGTAPTSTTHGSGTTSAGGVLTAAGLPAGAGFILVETADGGVYYQPGTIT